MQSDSHFPQATYFQYLPALFGWTHCPRQGPGNFPPPPGVYPFKIARFTGPAPTLETTQAKALTPVAPDDAGPREKHRCANLD